MLNDFTGADKIYIACGYTDLRKGIDGLARLVQQQFALDPFANTLFLFCLSCFVVQCLHGKQRNADKQHGRNGDQFPCGI